MTDSDLCISQRTENRLCNVLLYFVFTTKWTMRNRYVHQSQILNKVQYGMLRELHQYKPFIHQLLKETEENKSLNEKNGQGEVCCPSAARSEEFINGVELWGMITMKANYLGHSPSRRSDWEVPELAFYPLTQQKINHYWIQLWGELAFVLAPSS